MVSDSVGPWGNLRTSHYQEVGTSSPAKATGESIDDGTYVKSRRDAAVRKRILSGVHRPRRSSLHHGYPRVAEHRSPYGMWPAGPETRFNRSA
jgi:hypothetical protein